MSVASERKHGADRDRGGRSPSRTTPPATRRRYRAGPNAGRSDGPSRQVAGGAPRGCWYQGGSSLWELARRRPMAISLDRLENPVILFGPVLRHHAGGGLRASWPSTTPRSSSSSMVLPWTLPCRVFVMIPLLARRPV